MTDVKHKLPDGWKWVRLRSICETSSGGTPNRGTRDYYGGSIPWVKSGELNDGIVKKTSEFLTENGLSNSSAKVFPAGTLLIAMYGATVGRLGILGMEAATNQAVCALFTGRTINRDFLFYLLLHERPNLVAQSAGGAQPNISQEVIQNLEIPLPPLETQRRIAAKLEQQMQAVEQARVAAETQLETIQALPAALLREAFNTSSEKP